MKGYEFIQGLTLVLLGLVTLVIGGSTATIVAFSDLPSSDRLLVALGAGVLLLLVLLMVFLITFGIWTPGRKRNGLGRGRESSCEGGAGQE